MASMTDDATYPNVLHIASGDLWAGAEVQLFTLAKALHNDLDIRVDVVLLNTGKLEHELRTAGISTIVLDESRHNSFSIFYQLLCTIRVLRPNIIHTHRLKENILGSIAGFLSGRIPSIRTVHGAPEHIPEGHQIHKRIIHWLDRFCGRFLQDRIISVSDDLAQSLRQEFPDNSIHVIENGIDLERFPRIDRNRHAGSSADSTPFRIGLAGRLVPVKRVDLFIETARHIQQNYPNLHASFHVFGDGPLRSELEILNHELKTDDIVHFDGHCDDIYEKLKAIDLLLMTSEHEGLPMTLLEAMATGIPVIAHAVGGIPRLLDNGTCGILVQDHSSTGYAREIHKLANNPDISSTITRNALIRVNKEYSSSRNARAYLQEYIAIMRAH